MNYWSLKEVADNLNITYQAIYKNKEEYLKKGYIEKIDGVYKVNVQGYNYLLERKKKVANIPTPSIADGEATGEQNIKNEYVELLKNRVEQLENELKEVKQAHQKEIEQERERTTYFKTLFEQKDRQITALLLPGEEEKHNEQKTNKENLFTRLFNRH